MSSSAGLADSAKRSRIKRKAVRPPVAGRPLPAAPEAPREEERREEPRAATIEPSEVGAPVQPEPVQAEPMQRSTPEEQPSSKPKTEKKKAVVKKIGHTQPRFEVRLSGDHEKLVEDIQKKAFRESLAANKGINNSELFGGFLEAIRPFRKEISFSSLDFKRGKLYGDGTERIKLEVGKSLQRSAFQYFLSAIQEGRDEVVGDILSSLSEEARQKIASQILTQSVPEDEDERLVANS